MSYSYDFRSSSTPPKPRSVVDRKYVLDPDLTRQLDIYKILPPMTAPTEMDEMLTAPQGPVKAHPFKVEYGKMFGMGRLPARAIIQPPPKPNYQELVIVELMRIERRLCDLLEILVKQTALVNRISDDLDDATDESEKKMLAARKIQEKGRLATLGATISALEKQAGEIRIRLAYGEPPIYLHDPCDLWKHDLDVPLPPGTRYSFS